MDEPRGEYRAGGETRPAISRPGRALNPVGQFNELSDSGKLIAGAVVFSLPAVEAEAFVHNPLDRILNVFLRLVNVRDDAQVDVYFVEKIERRGKAKKAIAVGVTQVRSQLQGFLHIHATRYNSIPSVAGMTKNVIV
jgi:hypothetical protein